MTRFRLPPWLVCSREGSRQGWIEYLHTVAFCSHLVQPFNARASQYSCRYFFGLNSPAARARELFKPSTVFGKSSSCDWNKFCFSCEFGCWRVMAKNCSCSWKILLVKTTKKFCARENNWKQLMKTTVLVKTTEKCCFSCEAHIFIGCLAIIRVFRTLDRLSTISGSKIMAKQRN